MFPLTEQVVDILQKIRTKMHLQMENAWGPEAVDQPANSAAANAAPGVLGTATNPSDANDALNSYLIGVCDRLIGEFDFSEDEALDFVFDCADEMESDGTLPAMPEDGAAPQEISIWLGKANSTGFTAYVLGRARSSD